MRTLAERVAADGTWAPGDSEPVGRELRRMEPPTDYSDAAVAPMHLQTVIRDRCDVPLDVAVGPAEATPGPETPTNRLGPREAIWTWLTYEDCVFGKAATADDWRRVCGAGGFIVARPRGEGCDELLRIAG